MESRSHPRRLRPQVYFHVDFGVSWSAERPPKNHGFTYASRTLRERSRDFPRRVPAPTTNFLAPGQDSAPDGRSPEPAAPTHLTLPPQQADLAAWEDEGREEGRLSRAESTSSHERGRSAPPPFGDNPWDVSVPLEPPRATLFPSSSASSAGPAPGATSRPSAPDLWRPLPEVPSRFRLGEDGMPWSSQPPWLAGPEPDPYFLGYEERNSAQGTYRDPSGVRLHTPEPSSRGGDAHREAVAVVSSTSPRRQRSVEDPERVRQLEALSAAMVTVDNGFESQWWQQGPRQPVLHLPDEAVLRAETRFSRRSLGWAVATNATRNDSVSSQMAYTVSPMTEYTAFDTPPPSYQPLTRTLSTRSDEFLYR
ncbi:hypothetical protein VTK73DRAFT_722 [Phialemonium thermophilum]|uniref:Uncharacterized protein n=1 Tax=Phialemonium thermophilum TaxID=223376 RepID=A0ABR3VUD7_9PEZI